MAKIIVFDFGGQYCHLISRRLRDLGINSEIIGDEKKLTSALKKDDVGGIILSGGACSVYQKNSPEINRKFLEMKIPILGICYGHQLIVHLLGGKVQSGKTGEYGLTPLKISRSEKIFENLKSQEHVWMNHRDIVSELPRGFEILAETEQVKIAAYQNSKSKIYGVQFHPEVTHTRNGNKILENFVFKICGLKKQIRDKNLIETIIDEAKSTIGTDKAIIGLSGGVDSSVAAILTSKAIGKNLTAVYVDTGLMRFGETENIKSIFRNFNLDLKIINAGKKFFAALKGATSPEQKRKIIGKIFIDIFQKVARKTDAKFLVQGTIYPDRIESGLTKNSSNIKSHHNVGGLPKNLKLKIYEPLRNLYKDEVRTIARHINLPREITTRQVFPGPGLAVRIVGEVTPKKAEIVRAAGHIIEEELRKTKYWQRIWMSFAVLLPIKSVGIQGDERSYKYPIVIRIIESEDAMTANFSKIPYEILERISTRITNEIKDINRVVYDITNKPPATMEWE